MFQQLLSYFILRKFPDTIALIVALKSFSDPECAPALIAYYPQATFRESLEIIDDYAHHPTEIDVTLRAMKETRPDKKIVVVFEPHRYSRTRDCWDAFLHCFNSADTVYISPIYPASEQPIAGIESDRLIADINKLHPDLVQKLDAVENINVIIDKYKKENVTFVTLGAGSIGRIIREKTNN